MYCVALQFALLAAEPSAPSPSPDAREPGQSLLELAQKYEFYADRELTDKLKFESKPLLVYSNPVRGDVYGNVFIWTRRGRPYLIGAFYDYRDELRFTSEIHSLATNTLVGRRDDVTFWSPGKSGAEFRPIPKAASPLESEAARLRQMRELARQFTVVREHPEQGKGEVRLLGQPIFRYAAQEEGILDGAIFTFVEGTDPEAHLLIEASPADKPQWRFAFVRMNIVPFTGFLDGKVVWQVDAVSWESVFEQQEPYAIIKENPRRGLKRNQ
jgi:hypothetical protein